MCFFFQTFVVVFSYPESTNRAISYHPFFPVKFSPPAFLVLFLLIRQLQLLPCPIDKYISTLTQWCSLAVCFHALGRVRQRETIKGTWLRAHHDIVHYPVLVRPASSCLPDPLLQIEYSQSSFILDFPLCPFNPPRFPFFCKNNATRFAMCHSTSKNKTKPRGGERGKKIKIKIRDLRPIFSQWFLTTDIVNPKKNLK